MATLAERFTADAVYHRSRAAGTARTQADLKARLLDHERVSSSGATDAAGRVRNACPLAVAGLRAAMSDVYRATQSLATTTGAARSEPHLYLPGSRPRSRVSQSAETALGVCSAAMAKMSVRRKLAISTWASPREGNIYGKLSLDASNALKYLDEVREKTGLKVTMTHLVGAALGRALAKAPGLNGRIRFGRYVPHSTVDIAFLVALDGGDNLAKAKIERISEKSAADIAAELAARAGRLRDGEDEAFQKSMGPIRMLPTWLIRPLLWISGWLTSSLGVQLPALGLERFPFGSAIITSVGMFGLDEGWAPPTPFARVPLYVLIGALREMPAAEDGKVVIHPKLTLCATIDHRFLDGAQGGVLAKEVRRLLEDPWQMDAEKA